MYEGQVVVVYYETLSHERTRWTSQINFFCFHVARLDRPPQRTSPCPFSAVVMLAVTTAREREQDSIGEEYQVERQHTAERSEQLVALVLVWRAILSHRVKEICVLLPVPPKASLPALPSHNEPSDRNPSYNDPSDCMALGSTTNKPSDRKPTKTAGSISAECKPARPDPATTNNSDFAIAEDAH
jgi:hypothetical protein